MGLFLSRPWIILGFVTFASRGLLALFLGSGWHLERWEYDEIAANLVKGDGHVYERAGFFYAAYSPPVWSYVLAFLLWLPGNAEANIQCLQGLFCFASAVVYSRLAQRLSGSTEVALLTGLLVALQPSLLYYSVVKSDPLPLNILLLGLIVRAGADLVLDPRPRRAASLGFLLALGVLTRGTPIVVFPLVSFWLVARWKSSAALPIVLTAAAFAFFMAPWLIRNHLLLGRPLITTTAGENFWRGNHEGATGGVLDEDGGQITVLIAENPALPATIRSVIKDGTELDRQDIFLKEAVRFVRERPLWAARLFARKMRTFWWRIDSDPRDYSAVASALYEVLYRIELLLALVGTFVVARSSRCRQPARDRLAASLPIAIMVAVGILQSAFYVQGRHRFLIEPLLLMFTASGLFEITRWLRRPGRPIPHSLHVPNSPDLP